ncbi:MAG: hypothetical protein IKD89_06005 [Clostridia bacterium]|nr:hypothetical protein [Clostridia bacterium]
MKRKSVKKALALIVALAMVMTMGVFALAEPDAPPVVVFGEDNYAHFGNMGGDYSEPVFVTLPCNIEDDIQFVGLELVDVVCYSGDPEHITAAADAIGYQIGEGNSITFSLDTGLPADLYDWIFKPQILGNVTFEGENGEGTIRVLADVWNDVNIDEGSAVLFFSPNEVTIEDTVGYTETESKTVSVYAYDSETGGDVEVFYASADFTSDSQYFHEYLQWEAAGNAITFSLRPGLPAGEYSWEMCAADVECDRDEYENSTFYVTAIVYSDEPSSLVPYYSPESVEFTVEEGYETAVKKDVFLYVQDEDTGDIFNAAAKDIEVTVDEGCIPAGYTKNQMTALLNVEPYFDNERLHVSVTPTLPAGVYTWYVNTTLSAQATMCTGDPFTVTLTVTENENEENYKYVYMPGSVLFGSQEGYAQMLNSVAYLDVTNQAGSMVPFSITGAEVRGLTADSKLYCDKISVYPGTYEGREIMNICPQGGIPVGEYRFAITPELTRTYDGKTIYAPDYEIEVIVSPYDGVAYLELSPSYGVALALEPGYELTPFAPITIGAHTSDYGELNVTWADVKIGETSAPITFESDIGEYLDFAMDGSTLTISLKPGLPKGEYAWRLTPVPAEERDYDPYEFTISAVIADREPEPVMISSISCENGAVSLVWAGQDGVDGYRLYKKAGTGKWNTLVADTTDTSYTDTAVEVGKTYSYTVRSFIGSKYSPDYTQTAQTITVAAPPVEPKPVNITSIKCENGAVVLAWAGQDGVDGYRVHKKTGTGKWTTALASTTATTFTDTAVEVGKTYSYTVRSFVGSDYSTGYNDTAKSIKVTPAAVEPQPIEITSISCENGAVALAWAGQDGVDGYRVHKKTGTGKWTTAVASTTATSYTDNAVEVGKTYSYTVRSFVGSTFSTGYNDTAKSIKVTPAAVEPQPIEITSIKCVNGAVELAWAGQDGVDGYRVHKKTGTGKWTTAVAATTETSYTDTAVEVGKKYTYSVRSFVGSTYSTGYNDTAKTITVTAAAVEPQPIEITSIKCVNGAVELAWAGQDGVDGYRLYKKVGTGKWTTAVAATTDTSYTDTAVQVGKKYTYSVRSFVGSTYSTGYNDTAKTITVTAAAVEPQPIEITSIKCVNGAVELAWAGQDGVDGYRLYKKAGTGKWTTAVAATTDTSYTDTAVQEGKTYSYTLRSFVGSTYSTGYNDTAKTITVTAAAVEPQPVRITQTEFTNDGVIAFEWEPQPGVESYRVYKKTAAGKWATVCASTTNTFFTDADVEYGKTYTYTVRSCIGGVYSTGYNDTAVKITAK